MANESITKSEALRRIAESTEQIRLYAATIKTANDTTIKTANDKLQQVAATDDAIPRAPGG